MANQCSSELVVGILQRNIPLHKDTITALSELQLQTIVIDSTPCSPVVKSSEFIKVVHEPDDEGYFAITLLQHLFREFLLTSATKLLLIEGDMVLSKIDVANALQCKTNTKVFYQESAPTSPNAYVRCEGMAGVLLITEVKRIYEWMCSQNRCRFHKYEGYHDLFLWFSVRDENNSTFPVLHMTHDDSTRVTKRQRVRDKNLYRIRKAGVIAMAIECRNYISINIGKS